MSTTPDRLHIDEKDRTLYDKIEEEDIFSGRTRREQFLLAMSIGCKNDMKVSIDKREGFFLAKDLRSEDTALMYAVAINSEIPSEELSDLSKVYKMVEEYARGGIKLLTDKIESSPVGSFEKHFERDLFEVYNEFFGNEKEKNSSR